MSDTARTLASLLAVFADGQAKASITPSDMRDFLVSIQDAYGGMAMNTPAATEIETAGTFIKMAGITSLSTPNNLFTMPTSNRLTYTGTVARSFLITANASFSAAANNQVISFTSGTNGTPAIQQTRTKVGIAGDIVCVAGHRIVTLEPDDYLEVFVANETSDEDITVVNLAYYVNSLFG